MKLKCKKEDLLECYLVHWVQGNISSGKGAIATSQEQGLNRAGEGIVSAGYGNKKVQETTTKNKKNFLMLPHPLTNFEIQKYYQNLIMFNGVYSRDNLPKTKDGGIYKKS